VPSLPEPIIVLGANGFLGRNVTRYLRERGWPVVPIGREAGDLAEDGVADRLLGEAPPATRIFHLVTRQRTGPVQYQLQGELLAINSRIHMNVLEAWRCRQPQAVLISTGSSCAYPESDQPLAESMFQAGPLHPSVIGYGLAKQLLAVGCATYAQQYGLRYLHCILATVYGPGDHRQPDRMHFLTALLNRAVIEKHAGNSTLTVWGDPTTVREVLYVDDQIEAILAAEQAFVDRIVNCAANAPVTIDEVARAITGALDWKADLYYPPDSFRGASFKVLDSSMFLQATGWRPRVDLDTGLRRTLVADEVGVAC
jgi:GDP-L-fucose synthase